jgi:predicted nucleic acid-binding protein
MAFLIDTSVIVALERRNETDVMRALRNETGQEQLIALSAITVSELLVGVHRAQPESRMRQREAFVEALIDQNPVLDFDLFAARTHARIWAESLATGQRIPDRDLLIAATAIANDFTLLSIDASDFSRVPGLKLRIPHSIVPNS